MSELESSSTQMPVRSLKLRHWYAIYTRPRHEKCVSIHLAQREVEGFLPQYKVVHRWKNRCTKTLELPLFPGYVFVRIALSERMRVLDIPGVLSMVGSGREPIPLPDAEMDTLRAGLHLRLAEPHPYLVIGERARIRRGALEGMEGIVVRKKNSLRVVLTLDQIRQSIAVEVDGSDLDPLGHSPSGVPRLSPRAAAPTS